MMKGVRGQRTSLGSDACAIARALDAIGDWWSLLIIRDAMSSKRRFGEFQKSLGLAKNILTVRLRKLVDVGILVIEPASYGSAYKEYVLTEKSERLSIVGGVVAVGRRVCLRTPRDRAAYDGRAEREAFTAAAGDRGGSTNVGIVGHQLARIR